MLNSDTLCPGCFSDSRGLPSCPHCQFREEERRDPLLLPYRTELREAYIIGRVLATGGFGSVYLAYDQTRSMKVAIKEYLPAGMVARDSSTLEVRPKPGLELRFRAGLEQLLREFTILRRLRHANLSKVIGHFEEKGTGYLVMEYLDGENLGLHLDRYGRKLPPEQALEIIRPLLDGLEQAHLENILHLDVKPSNIFLCRNKTPLLIDFGSAQPIGSTKGAAVGPETTLLPISHGYSAPEQYRGNEGQGPWTDIYAVGATLYEMLTGRRPPAAPSRAEKDQLIPPSRCGIELPNWLEEAVLKSLALSPDKRPQDVQAFRELLKSDLTEFVKVKTDSALTHLKRAVPYLLAVVPLALILASLFFPLFQERSPALLTGEPFSMHSKDFYLIHDASGVVDESSYPGIEDTWTDRLRPREGDRASFAYFGANVYSGDIEGIRCPTSDLSVVKNLRGVKPPKGITQSTRFELVFDALSEKATLCGEDRDAVALVLTDGVPDPKSERRLGPGNAPHQMVQFIPNNVRASLGRLLRTTKFEVVIVIVGSDTNYAEDIQKAWERLLKEENLENLSGKLHVVSGLQLPPHRKGIADFALEKVGRAPCLGVRPALDRLSDEERVNLEANKIFAADFYFQPMLENIQGLKIQRATLASRREKPIDLNVLRQRRGTNSAILLLESSGTLSQDEDGWPLFFHIREPNGVKIKSDEVYEIKLDLAGQALCSVPPNLMADLGDGAWRASNLQQALLLYSPIFFSLAAGFFVACAKYPAIKKTNRWLARILRYLFIEPLWFWFAAINLVTVAILCFVFWTWAAPFYLTSIAVLISLLAALFEGIGARRPNSVNLHGPRLSFGLLGIKVAMMPFLIELIGFLSRLY